MGTDDGFVTRVSQDVVICIGGGLRTAAFIFNLTHPYETNHTRPNETNIDSTIGN